MKIKNLIFGVVGMASLVCIANADTANIKAACQASEKTLWVERNQVCIPRNPCKDSKYEAYCNRKYKEIEVARDYAADGYTSTLAVLLVKAYAEAHNLSCEPVREKTNIVGQDYVICMGDDVMVFEFDDTNDWPFGTDVTESERVIYLEGYLSTLCRAVNGDPEGSVFKDSIDCRAISESTCENLQRLREKYVKAPYWVDMKWEDYRCVLTYLYYGLW